MIEIILMITISRTTMTMWRTVNKIELFIVFYYILVIAVVIIIAFLSLTTI